MSLFVTAVHSQWEFLPTASTGLPIMTGAGGFGNAIETQTLRNKLLQLNAEVARSKAGGGTSPLSSISPLQEQCPPCPSCGPGDSSQLQVAGGGGSSVDAAFDAYIELHRRILAGEAGVPQKFIIARPQAQMNNRLRVIISGIALGIITGRAFIGQGAADRLLAAQHVAFLPSLTSDLAAVLCLCS